MSIWDDHPSVDLQSALEREFGYVDFKQRDRIIYKLWPAFERWVRRRGWPGDRPCTHTAAVSGCTGTGEDGVELTWLWTNRHGWRLWTHHGACIASNGLRAPGGCTATTAVLEGVGRDG